MRTADCCGCLGLRAGSLAIGVVFVTLTALSTAAFAGALLYLSARGQPLFHAAYLALFFVTHAISLVFNGLLVHGVRTDSAGPVHVWVLYHRTVLAVAGAAVGVLFVFGCVHGSALLLVLAAVGVPLVIVLWYCYAVVHSHYEQLLTGSVSLCALKRNASNVTNL